ncbi:PKD domain-containing protein [candidate division WOR-3 bacterium]|uniref:PKD domain-containing protein n=1 Tax=candidate division WOR-3 bacterium TaxID=2052148 RepID=A0A9D5QC65_UNCW3|nr:PKD domain-containing protein [candidate division WOR-3 bacterium]MBD3364348.1 PKD domain-containing protein [candidate division WOR-3 bacterium]
MKRVLAVILIIAALLVTGCATKGPEAAFSADVTSGTPPLEVSFTDESTGDPTSWSWDFGDGSTSTEQNPTHTFADTGSFDVTLVCSNENDADTLTMPAYIVVTDAPYSEEVVGDFTFKWRTRGEVIDVILSAPTTGWVAVGFDPTTAMKDANYIIGYVDGEKVTIIDEFGDGNFSHTPDTDLEGADDVANADGSEADGSTTISFTIPLDSGDDNDKVLAVGQTYKVIFAYGPDGADDFTTKHASRASADIEL